MPQFDAKELFGDFPDVWEFMEEDSRLEICWEWPVQTGNGSMHIIKFRPGFMMGINDFKLTGHTFISVADIYNPLIFNFGLCGTIDTTYDLEEGRKRICTSKANYTTASYFPKYHEATCVSVGSALKSVSVYVAPQLLQTMTDASPDRIPVLLYEIAAGADSNQLYQISPTDFQADIALRQILACPYQGVLRRLYLESKALELITHSLARWVPVEAGAAKPFALRPQDIERVHHARELIGSDLVNPPKLLDLARSVGLPHPRLNFGFRELFGTTVFDYIRQARLKKARSLLDEGRMNVTEVAYAVGYSSLSHFAKSFKKYHGTPPGTYLRKILSNGVPSPFHNG